MNNRTCANCNASFTIPKQRGRPAIKCEACRTSKAPATPKPLLSDPNILKDPAKLRELAAKLEANRGEKYTVNNMLANGWIDESDAARLQAADKTDDAKVARLTTKPIVRKGRVFAPVIEAPEPEPIIAPIPVGSRVRVKARLWRGIHRPGLSGRILAWERDSKGTYAVVESRGERVLARPENLKLA